MEAIVAVAQVNTMFIASLLVIMKLVLGIRVTLYRMRTNIPWDDANDDGMARRIRAHANHSEWVPATIMILALIEMIGVAPIIGVLGIITIIGRALHAPGAHGQFRSVQPGHRNRHELGRSGPCIPGRDHRVFSPGTL